MIPKIAVMLLFVFTFSGLAQDLLTPQVDSTDAVKTIFTPVHSDQNKAKSTKVDRAAISTLTPPNMFNFGFANQGACSVAQNPGGSMTLFHPGASGLGFNWCVLADLTQPLTPPYTIIVKTSGHVIGKAASLGLVLYDVYTGKFIVYSMPGSSDAGYAGMAAWKMNSFTSYSGAYFAYTNGIVMGSLPKFIRIKNNGTTRTIAISNDNNQEVWLTIHATAATDFISPNLFGYALRGTGDGVASIMTVEHQAITNP